MYPLRSRVEIHRNSSAGAPGRGHSVPLYKTIPVSPDLLSVGGGTLHTISARFGTHSPARAISGEAEPECFPSPRLRQLGPPRDTGRGRASTAESDVTAIAPFAFLSRKVPPPTNLAVQSVPVSTCRLLVVTKQTDGAIFVGGCEADGGSA